VGKVTAAQRKIGQMYMIDGLTSRQIAHRLGKSRQYIQKVLNGLSRNGILKHRLPEGGSTQQPLNQKKYELHGIQLDIRPHRLSDSYTTALKDTGRRKLHIEGCTVLCYAKKVEVYTDDLSWQGETCSHVTQQAMAYLNRILPRIENRTGAVLLKPQSDNCRIVASHYARWDATLARWAKINDYSIRCHASDDGKLWLLCDFSKGVYHMETVHPTTAKQDMEEVIEPFLGDLREHWQKTGELIKLTDILKLLHDTAKMNQETAAGLQAMIFLKDVNSAKKVSAQRPDYIL
jgi:hypothetical protein